MPFNLSSLKMPWREHPEVKWTWPSPSRLLSSSSSPMKIFPPSLPFSSSLLSKKSERVSNKRKREKVLAGPLEGLLDG